MNNNKNNNKWFFMIMMLLSPVILSADLPSVTVIDDINGKTTYALSMQIVLLMTVLTILPAVLLCMTAFTRIIIVFSILRQAIGMAQTPNNQILIGISLFLTLFVMAPVMDKINVLSVQPFVAEKISFKEAIENASTPIKDFMLGQTRENDLKVFTDLMNKSEDESDAQEMNENLTSADVSMTVLLPAFLTSELKTAFQIGFMIFIPFMVIDLVVASVLMAMGMMMLSPLIISLPFKIMLFILIDGWTLIVSTLAGSFGG